MSPRRLVPLILGLFLLLPAAARAEEEEVVVPADRLAAELGRRVARALKVDVAVVPSDRVALIAPGGSGQLLYNPGAMIRLEQSHGQEAVAGLVAHWIGYLKNPQGGALLAEAQAGCAFARLGLKHQGYQRAVAASAVGVPSGPLGQGRSSALLQGYLNCLMGQEPRVPEAATAAATSGPRLAPALAPFRLAPALAPFTSRSAPRKKAAAR